jgi:hypothetical protein
MRLGRPPVLLLSASASIALCLVTVTAWAAAGDHRLEQIVALGDTKLVLAVGDGQRLACADRHLPVPVTGTPAYDRIWDFSRPEALRKVRAGGFAAWSGEAAAYGPTGVKMFGRVRGVAAPAWFTTAGCLVLPSLWLNRFVRRRRLRDRAAAGRCAGCGYDLRATPQCRPECGRPPSVDSRRAAYKIGA